MYELKIVSLEPETAVYLNAAELASLLIVAWQMGAHQVGAAGTTMVVDIMDDGTTVFRFAEDGKPMFRIDSRGQVMLDDEVLTWRVGLTKVNVRQERRV